MPDVITDQERRAIDAALAAGRVEVCPPRTFALDAGTSIPWAKQVKSFWQGATSEKKRWMRGRPLDPAVAERRQKVLALADGTRHTKEIADRLNLTAHIVKQDILELRSRGHTVPMPAAGGSSAGGGVAAVTSRRKRVLALADGTRSTPEIAAAIGAHTSTVEHDIATLRKGGHAILLRDKFGAGRPRRYAK